MLIKIVDNFTWMVKQFAIKNMNGAPSKVAYAASSNNKTHSKKDNNIIIPEKKTIINYANHED